MGARDITYYLVRVGISPQVVSRVRKTSLRTTLGYLDQMIGEGRLRRSDVFFSVPKEVRDKCRQTDPPPTDVSDADLLVVSRYGDSAAALGDMYEDLRCIEVSIHAMVKEKLAAHFGDAEAGWWRQGVPEQTRKTCQVRREEDSDPAPEPFCYTDLLDLARIIEANWSLFSQALPSRYATNRKVLLEDFRHLNVIRRDVMHPVRGGVPSEDQFEFARRLRIELAPLTLDPDDERKFQELREQFRGVELVSDDEKDA